MLTIKTSINFLTDIYVYNHKISANSSLNMTKEIKSPYWGELTPNNSLNRPEKLSQIKHLIPRSIKIDCNPLGKNSLKPSGVLSYRMFQKKSYSKVQSIKFYSKDDNHNAKKYDHSVLLRLTKKTKAFPSLHIDSKYILNNKVMRKGFISSRIKSMDLHMDDQPIGLLKDYIHLIQKARGLSQMSIDLYRTDEVAKTQDRRNQLFYHLCKILQGHNLDQVEIVQRFLEGFQLNTLSLLTALKKNTRKFSVSYYHTSNEIIKEWRYQCMRHIIDDSKSQVKFHFSRRFSEIQWRIVQSDKSDHPPKFRENNPFIEKQSISKNPDPLVFSTMYEILCRIEKASRQEKQMYELVIIASELKLDLLKLRYTVDDKLDLEDLLMIEHLRPSIKDFTIYCSCSTVLVPGSAKMILAWNYFYRTRILSPSESEIHFYLANKLGFVEWKGIKADDTSQSPQGSVNFWEKPLQSFGDFGDIRRTQFLSQRRLQPGVDHLRLANILETVREMKLGVIVPPDQQVMNSLIQSIKTMTAMTIIDVVGNRCDSQDPSCSLVCNTRRFLENFLKLIRSQTYSCSNVALESGHLAELSGFIKHMALTAIKILQASYQTPERICELFETATNDFHINKTQLIRLVYGPFFSPEESQFLETHKLTETKPVIEQMSDDVRKQCYSEHMHNALEEALARTTFNLCIIVLNHNSPSCYTTELTIMLPNFYRNQGVALPSTIMCATNYTSLKVISLKIFIKQEDQYHQYVSDLELLTGQIPQLACLKLCIFAWGNPEIIEKAINSPPTRPGELSSAIRDANELSNMRFIRRIFDLAAKLRSLIDLSLKLMADPKNLTSQLSGLISHRHCRHPALRKDEDYSDLLDEEDPNTGILTARKILETNQSHPQTNQVHALLTYLKDSYNRQLDPNKFPEYALRKKYLLNNYASSYALLDSLKSLIESPVLKFVSFESQVLQNTLIMTIGSLYTAIKSKLRGIRL